MKKISILGMFILFCFISCGKDSKIKEILKETHEDEIKEAVESFDSLIHSINNFFYVDENGFIDYLPEYVDAVQKIGNLHKQYHNSELLPRDSEKWETLMYYVKNPDGKKHSGTVCPFCIAEALGKLEKDKLYWKETSLFEASIVERQEELYSLLKDDEMIDLLSQFEDYLATEKCFTDEPGKNCSFTVKVGNNEYGVLATKEYNQFMNKIRSFHDENCKYRLFSSVANTLFFDSSLTHRKKISCPICRIAHKKIEEKSFKKEDENFSYYTSDFYIWDKNEFADRLFTEYIKKQEKMILPAEWQECRLLGFNYSASAAMYGYYLPSPFKNKKAGVVFNKKNVLSKSKDAGTYGVLKDVNIYSSDYKAKFDYECYVVSDRPDTYGQVKKMGDLSFTVKFSPSDKTAFIYSATIKTESSGKSQTFDYDGVIYDEESMANAVEGFLVWIIDTDKL